MKTKLALLVLATSVASCGLPFQVDTPYGSVNQSPKGIVVEIPIHRTK
jgi:hypothetical protein